MEPVEVELTDEVLLGIHTVIHDQLPYIEINGVRYNLQRNLQNQCCYIEINNIKFMEQNPHKSSKYALLAQQGHKITWGIRPGNWLLIMDGEIKIR